MKISLLNTVKLASSNTVRVRSTRTLLVSKNVASFNNLRQTSSWSFLSSNPHPKSTEKNEGENGNKNHNIHVSHDDHHGIHGAKHQLSHRVKEKVGIKFAEKAVGVVPRLLSTKKRLGFAIFARKIVRGVAIAVPAIGGIFGAIVAYSDYKRFLKERSAGHKDPMVAFGIAFNVVCHAYTAFLLSGTHWHHEHIHLTEELSLAAAIVATGSAIAGEVLTPIEGVSALKVLTGKLKASTQVFKTSSGATIEETTIKTEQNEVVLTQTKKQDDDKDKPDDIGRIGFC